MVCDLLGGILWARGHSSSRTFSTNMVFFPGGQHKSGMPSKKGSIVVALYNYQGSEHGDMTFVKGDIMEIVDDTDPDWWLAKNINGGGDLFTSWDICLLIGIFVYVLAYLFTYWDICLLFGIFVYLLGYLFTS